MKINTDTYSIQNIISLDHISLNIVFSRNMFMFFEMSPFHFRFSSIAVVMSYASVASNL